MANWVNNEYEFIIEDIYRSPAKLSCPQAFLLLRLPLRDYLTLLYLCLWLTAVCAFGGMCHYLDDSYRSWQGYLASWSTILIGATFTFVIKVNKIASVAGSSVIVMIVIFNLLVVPSALYFTLLQSSEINFVSSSLLIMILGYPALLFLFVSRDLPRSNTVARVIFGSGISLLVCLLLITFAYYPWEFGAIATAVVVFGGAAISILPIIYSTNKFLFTRILYFLSSLVTIILFGLFLIDEYGFYAFSSACALTFITSASGLFQQGYVALSSNSHSFEIPTYWFSSNVLPVFRYSAKNTLKPFENANDMLGTRLHLVVLNFISAYFYFTKEKFLLSLLLLYCSCVVLRNWHSCGMGSGSLLHLFPLLLYYYY
jgi:hypothetical protein